MAEVFGVAYGDSLYALARLGGELRLLRIKGSSEEVLASFRGSNGHIAFVRGNDILISVDHNLYLFSNGIQLVLRVKEENYIWTCSGVDVVVCSEYGEKPTSPPTGMYMSKDLKTWIKLFSNFDVDRHSKHFHHVAYDRYRNTFYATLGDGNIVRVIKFNENGYWSLIYKGPWQFVPIIVEKDRVIFGFDSAIAKGGVGIYDPYSEKMNFIFLKHLRGRHAQFIYLYKLGNGYLGFIEPFKDVVFSEDLHVWYKVNVEIPNASSRSPITVINDKAFIITKSGVVTITTSNMNIGGIIMREYGAYLDRLRGFAFILKRINQSL